MHPNLAACVRKRLGDVVADAAGDASAAPTNSRPAAASRLRTIMPVLRVTIGITVLILGSLLVMSQLGVNITPLMAAAGRQRVRSTRECTNNRLMKK